MVERSVEMRPHLTFFAPDHMTWHCNCAGPFTAPVSCVSKQMSCWCKGKLTCQKTWKQFFSTSKNRTSKAHRHTHTHTHAGHEAMQKPAKQSWSWTWHNQHMDRVFFCSSRKIVRSCLTQVVFVKLFHVAVVQLLLMQLIDKSWSTSRLGFNS